MKFIVTGGAGFIGNNIVRQLLRHRHDVTVVDNLHSGKLDNLTDLGDMIEFKKIDILNVDELKKLVRTTDGVFHEAALTVVQESYQKREEYWKVNVRGTENILKLANDIGFKVVFASSSSVYGNVTKIPIKENFERYPINPYGQTKLEDEHLAEKFHELGVKVIGLRYFNVYGEKQNPAYAGVITKFMERIRGRLPPIIYGDGSQIRDFIYVKDVAEANIKAMMGPTDFGFFNIGSGNTVSIKQLAQMMIRSSRLDIDPIYEKTLDGDIKASKADTSLAKETLLWKSTKRLQDWFDETIPNNLST